MNGTQDLTKGKVSTVVLKFYFPMLFANLLQQIYSFVDSVIVGKGLGDNAFAAVGNMASLSFLLIGFLSGMTNGFSVLIAQAYGAENYTRLRKVIAETLRLSLVISVVLTVIGVGGLKPILILLQTPNVIIRDSLLYGAILFGGLTITMLYNLCAGILRALGDSKTPFAAVIISSVVNNVLDCILIFGFKTGVEGAAIATIVAQAVSVGVCYSRIRKISLIKITRKDFCENASVRHELLRNGVPAACMNSVTAFGCMIVQYYVNGLGVVFTSAYSAGTRYINLFILPSLTAGFAVSSFVSQNYGAKEFERIREGVKVCLWIALTANFLRICGGLFFILNFLLVYRNAVQGMGYPIVPMYSGVLEMVLRVAVMMLLLARWGFMVTAVAEVVAWTGAFLLNAIRYRTIIIDKKKDG